MKKEKRNKTMKETSKKVHPSIERINDRIKNYCKTEYKTARGLLRYLRGIKEKKSWLYSSLLVDEGTRMSILGWKDKERERKSDPEVKRCRVDVKFRASFLRKIRRRERAAIAKPESNLRECMKNADTFKQRKDIAQECARLRSLILGKKCEPVPVVESHLGVLVEGISEKLAREHGINVILRGKDARIIATRRSSYGVHRDPVPSKCWNGKWYGYERAVHDNYVRSLGFIKSPTVLEYVFHTTEITLTLPDGFSWNVDRNGLRVIHQNGHDDLHVTPEMLLADNAVQRLVDTLKANAEKRAQMRAALAAEAAEVEGVYVCLADSLRAGNCLAGSLAFAKRHGLDTKKHYRAPDLLMMANGDAGRVRIAITAARLRHKREMEQGFSVLAEHKV